MTKDRLIDKLAAVKTGLQVFGVEKRLKELEDKPTIIQGKGSSGGGVSDHSALTELDYASAGHTGFGKSIVASATAPSNPVLGQMYIDTDDNTLYIYWGSWQSTGITLTPPAPPVIGVGQPIGLTLVFTYAS